MNKAIIQGTKFNPSKQLTFTKSKVNSVGGKNVGILNKETRKATDLSTPLMLTWGVNEYVDDKSGRKTYDMSLQFLKDEYATDATREFLKNMVEFEKLIKDSAIKNSKEWLGKSKMSEDVVDALMTPILRYPKDQNTGEPDHTRAPTLRLKLPYWQGEWRTELYDMDQERLFPNDNELTPLELISKGTNVATVIQCGGVWFANGKFGVTWKLVQAVVKPKATLKGKCHILLSEEDKQAMKTSNNDEEDEEDEEMTTQVVSSDDENDENDVETEVKEAVVTFTKPSSKPTSKKKVKKKVKKKKVASDE